MAGIAGSDKPNIRQVADIAGVSHMTVSRVLNNYPNIRESTRTRVLEVIEELNYRPNSAARALASQRSRRIGVIVDSSSENGPASTLRSVELAARQAGYSVSSIALGSDVMSPQEALEHLTALGIDALCVIAPRSSSVSTLRTLAIGVPVLVIKADRDPTFLTVAVDQQQGTRLAVDHLASLGHRDVLHVAGPLDWLDARARERAFHSRARSWGIHERAIVIGDWTADFGYDFARTLTTLPDYTAMFVANDEMAFGVIHGLHENGFSVPRDISIVGFDDLAVSRHFLPPLTTVRQDFAALGERVVEALRAAVEGNEVPQRTAIPAELLVRQSTGPPRTT
ncbi:DNA-binding LacI/PurR family transcriptional regulator [Microbacterium endophyticum]|uniref:DNA-binding LacI/PurR family transcriptional regulator n=1 Tax=Microbacterium endophyticum TaxID=1526412 RepID=A0A7W4V2B3_9MICO|nr:DNA-binding LacI/PurR family transcriptional regulator [Microbacterium endophyticum]